ncbi:hypothetical protein McaMca56_007903 [Microsporum canis]
MATPGRPAARRWMGKPHKKGPEKEENKKYNRPEKGEAKNKLCRFIEHGKKCPYGDKCTYSHDISNSSKEQTKENSDSPTGRRERENYNSWKKIIKNPPITNDIATIKRLWTGALDILDGFDRNWKQMLPRDLESDDYYGREHIQTLLSMRSHGSGYQTFVDLSQPFLSVITHPAILDCLSVDTAVGGLYNFISGANGQRAVEFFLRLCNNLEMAYGDSTVSKTTTETTLIAMGIALRELLKREQRAIYHDDIPKLVDSLEKVAAVLEFDAKSSGVQVGITELRARIGRATGLLKDKETEVLTVDGVSTTVKSSYPRPIIIPGTRHDNDNADITKIKIFPTEEEIRSDQPDYLPTTDRDQPHFITNAAERHIDTLFRLLRHDTFGELKGALGILIHAIGDDTSLLKNWKLPLGDMRAYAYPNAHIRYVTFKQKEGIEAQVSFSQLPVLRGKSASNRCKWWEDSKRLEEGILLCFVTIISGRPSILFLTVSKKDTDPNAAFNLGSHEYISTINTKLATRNQANFGLLTELSCRGINGILIEFPGIIPATFMPILKTLQDLQRSSYLPFQQWILPEIATTSGGPALIPPPLYARGRGYSFPLDSILTRESDRFSFSPDSSPGDSAVIRELETRTTLDHGQCQALAAALTREYAFIQGPPGTGKSFIGIRLMRVLLACKKKSKLGPVVVVCYTNHALDQFLEELVQAGVEKIIRIGGQSKSKVLEGKNLRIVSQSEGKTKTERYLAAKTYGALRNNEPNITKLLASLRPMQKRRNWNHLKNHIKERYPRIFSQFSQYDEDGYETMGKDPFDIWGKGSTPQQFRERFSSDEDTIIRESLIRANTESIFNLAVRERQLLIEFWMQELHEINTDQLFELVDDSHKHYEHLGGIHDEVDRRVLETADVIGVTTTGLAKRISVLRHIRSKVVICEEAGEVMEPHMISALLPSVEHFIQIGDHQQLRPQINNYGLSLESKQGGLYQLDRSQFERLSVGEPGRTPFPVAQLDTQRRMRPEISTLIRETLYPRLIDHPSTKTFPDVVGMRHNVFWLDHENMENSAGTDRHQKSHSNDWEVDMTHSLVRHIVRQGVYNSRDIAVLTPYTGQLQKLRTKLRNDFEIVLSDRDQETLAKDGFDEDSPLEEDLRDVTKRQIRPLTKKKLSEFLRIATVDNFQGEESKIIIISLVRSNKEKKVGFLRTTNRINVLLSRAQHGMYLIGNADTYSNIPMWAHVLGLLEASHSVGKEIGLCCSRHMDTVMRVSEPLDFEKFSPEASFAVSVSRSKSQDAIILLKFPALGMCHPQLSSVRQSVRNPCLVATAAPGLVANATRKRNTRSVPTSVEDASEPATIRVPGHVITVLIVGRACHHVKLNALILNAHYAAMNPKCSARLDARVDFLEMKSYGEIDVDESPIVVLGCGHFFTAESLDGLMSMGEVYELDAEGEFTGLKDISTALAQSVPFCPDCKCSVRQFATQRYNRVVNRAVIDEMSKRFLSSGRDGLRELERRIDKLQKRQHKTREKAMEQATESDRPLTPAQALSINQSFREGNEEAKKLVKAVVAFQNAFADKCQPAQKLHEATIHAARRVTASGLSVDIQLANLNLSDEVALPLSRDSQITMGGLMAQIKTEYLIIDNKFIISKGLGSIPIERPGKSPGTLAPPFLEVCKKFAAECEIQNLPKLAVEASLFYASIARSFEYLCRSSKTNLDAAEAYIGTAKQMLEKAHEICQLRFHNAEGLRAIVEESIASMKKEWYEEVTSAEKEAIKAAMLSGPRGIATHSGHWYNCANGHPFVIGECGMPMELARCPECGASIGGQHHTAVSGVTRATEMEN